MSSDPSVDPAVRARWQRPVPLVGDRTSASERAADPAAWAFPASAVDTLRDVIGARRDVRRYRPEPVPDEVLTRVLEAGHAAPSVGHSQPWRFIVVTQAQTRERAAVMADRARLAQAAQMTPDRGRRLLDLQLEGIREAPVGVVVACDRRVAAAGVLGRATFPDADLWSCACAVENMWLTARALGLGMGWVTLFRPEELAELLHLPDGVETLGWLCLGWPDERPPAPGLERNAWSRRIPLAEVVLHERWPEDADAPAVPVSHLRAPDQAHVVAATDDADQLLTPPGSLGVLDRALNRLEAVGCHEVRGGTLVLAAADHPVTGLGVSAFPAGTTREVASAALVGEALGAVAARAAGLGLAVVDAGVAGDPLPGARPSRPRDPRGDLAGSDALSAADVDRLIESGRALGTELAGVGLVALGEVGVGNTTVAAALTCALLGREPAEIVGLGAGSDADIVERKTEVVVRGLGRLGTANAAPAMTDPLTALATVGGPEIAVLTGVVLGAAEAGTAVVLDGLAASLPALIACRLTPAVQAYLVAGQVSRETGHRLVLAELGLEPLLDLRIRAGEGVGACLATGLILDGLRIRREAGRVE